MSGISSFETGTFVGRAWSVEAKGPVVVTIRGGRVYDITSQENATIRDLLEREKSRVLRPRR